MRQMESTENADMAALARYACYRQVWRMVRSCRQLAMTPDRQAAYERVERAVLVLMDEEWPRLAGDSVETRNV